MSTVSIGSMGANIDILNPQVASSAMNPNGQTDHSCSADAVCPISLKPYPSIKVPVRILSEQGLQKQVLEPQIYEREELEEWMSVSGLNSPTSPISRGKILKIVDCVGSLSAPSQQQETSMPSLPQETAVPLNFSQKILKTALNIGVFVLKVLASIALTSTIMLTYTLIGAVCGLVIPGALIGFTLGLLAGIKISQNVFWEGKELFCNENKNIFCFSSNPRENSIFYG